MRLIHKLLCFLAAAVPVAALAGCSSGGSSALSGPPPEVSTITIDVVPTADAAGIYIAKDLGLFKQQGLNVKIQVALGGELAMPDIQPGATKTPVQLIEGNYVSFIQAQINGHFGIPGKTPDKPFNARIIANSSLMQPGNQGLYVMPDSPYKTVQQLANARVTVGVNTLKNIGAVFLGSLLNANGYKRDALVQKAEILPLMPELLAQHKVPAAWMPEPFATQAQQQFGAIELADFDQGSLVNFPIGCVIGNTKWIQQHPNTVAAFLRAYNQGQQIADTDRAAVEKALLKNVPKMTPGIAATMTLNIYPLAMDIPVMQRVPDAMLQVGIIKKHYDITKMIQPEPGEVMH